MINNRKGEHHHELLHIRISFGAKLQLKQIILFTPAYFHGSVTIYLLENVYHLLRLTFT